MRDIRRCTRQRIFFTVPRHHPRRLYTCCRSSYFSRSCRLHRDRTTCRNPVSRHSSPSSRWTQNSTSQFRTSSSLSPSFRPGRSRNQRHRSYRSFRQPLFHQRIHISSFRCPEPTFLQSPASQSLSLSCCFRSYCLSLY